MEHLTAATGHNRISWGISTLCIILGYIGNITANELLVYISIISLTVNIGFTVHKWVLMGRKGKAVD